MTPVTSNPTRCFMFSHHGGGHSADNPRGFHRSTGEGGRGDFLKRADLRAAYALALSLIATYSVNTLIVDSPAGRAEPAGTCTLQTISYMSKGADAWRIEELAEFCAKARQLGCKVILYGGLYFDARTENDGISRAVFAQRSPHVADDVRAVEEEILPVLKEIGASGFACDFASPVLEDRFNAGRRVSVDWRTWFADRGYEFIFEGVAGVVTDDGALVETPYPGLLIRAELDQPDEYIAGLSRQMMTAGYAPRFAAHANPRLMVIGHELSPFQVAQCTEAGYTVCCVNEAQLQALPATTLAEIIEGVTGSPVDGETGDEPRLILPPPPSSSDIEFIMGGPNVLLMKLPLTEKGSPVYVSPHDVTSIIAEVGSVMVTLRGGQTMGVRGITAEKLAAAIGSCVQESQNRFRVAMLGQIGIGPREMDPLSKKIIEVLDTMKTNFQPAPPAPATS